MKIKKIALDDGVPTHVTVRMTADEAALVARLTGSLNPQALREALGEDAVDASFAVSAALGNHVFNSFYNDGLNEAVGNIETISVVRR